MRIGIDATWARVVASGTGSYTRGLVQALVQHEEHQFVLYFQSADILSNPLFPIVRTNVRCRVVDGWGQPGRTLLSLTLALREDRLDVFHSPGYFLPLWSGPKVVTFHDANMFLQWDKWLRSGAPLTWLSLCAQSLLSSRTAQRVLAVSEHAARDIRRVFRLPERRLSVLYEGVDDSFFRPDDSDERPLQRHDLQEYLLFVGVLSPMKNLEGILRAFALLDRPGLKLAIAGREHGTYLRQVILPLIRELGLKDRVVLLGTVESEVLPCLYRGARALIYPSFAEGFGLPPLEAMACGTPVVASNRPSLPEVLGDAALLVEPADVAAIAGALERILDDVELRALLVRRGKARAERFRWSAIAERALEVYADVA